eukprot:TRINITY_DN19676_c0_g2_i1.p1 TRINITY_DN19676_c0_g2~~TRINITY_DN19676_c0_g2_i1.p1  ORF type:complete len:162 (+),score=7.82 TRINITY_DN19676_c0_g2_i1:140-625(+)
MMDNASYKHRSSAATFEKKNINSSHCREPASHGTNSCWSAEAYHTLHTACEQRYQNAKGVTPACPGDPIRSLFWPICASYHALRTRCVKDHSPITSCSSSTPSGKAVWSSFFFAWPTIPKFTNVTLTCHSSMQNVYSRRSSMNRHQSLFIIFSLSTPILAA